VPENTAYFEAITSTRAMLLSEEQQLEGQTTLSVETCSDFTDYGLFNYVQENFADFLRNLRHLKRDDQELLLSYYLLGKSQDSLAPLFHITQTVCSTRLRLAVKTLCLFMMMGLPTAEKMKPILEKAGVENLLPEVGMSECIALFMECKSFKAISSRHHIYHANVRRAMRLAANLLIGATDSHGRPAAKKQDSESLPDMGSQSLGCFIYQLIDKAHATKAGLTEREQAKNADIDRTGPNRDPDILGEFRIRVEDPHFDKLFCGRANISS
jgi:hypothetical protein